MEKEEKQSQIADNIEPLNWYFNWFIILLSFLLTGPLGLLLLWFRPRTNITVKILLSIFVLVFTFWMTYGAVDYYQNMADYYEQLELQMKNM